ncbi:hypothetical protein [Spongorhabdus nitratireducens]
MPRGRCFTFLCSISCVFCTEAAIFWLNPIPEPIRDESTEVSLNETEGSLTGFAVAIANKLTDKYCEIDFERHLLPSFCFYQHYNPGQNQPAIKLNKVSYDADGQLHLQLNIGDIRLEEQWHPEGYSLTTGYFYKPDLRIPVLEIMVAAKTYQSDSAPKTPEELADYKEEQWHRISCSYQALTRSRFASIGHSLQPLEALAEITLQTFIRQPEAEKNKKGKRPRKQVQPEDVPDIQFIFCLPLQLQKIMDPELYSATRTWIDNYIYVSMPCWEELPPELQGAFNQLFILFTELTASADELAQAITWCLYQDKNYRAYRIIRHLYLFTNWQNVPFATTSPN